MRHRIRWLIGLIVVVVVLVAASGAASAPRVSVSLQLRGLRLAVSGAVTGPAARESGAGRWRAVLEQQGQHGAWTARATGALARRGRSLRYSVSWSAPASATVVVVRVAVLVGKRLLATTRPRRVVVRRAPTPPAATSCGGEVPPPKPGGGAWTCTFDDEFDATTGDATALNSSSWIPQQTGIGDYSTGVFGSDVCYVDSPQTISVSGGALHLSVLKTWKLRLCGSYLTSYVGGMVSTYQRFDQEYGRFEVRALLPAAETRGLQETLWLWPADDRMYGPWPGSGEVDFGEFYSDQPSLVIPYIHYLYDALDSNATTETNTVTTPGCPIAQGQYNDYAVVWSPGTFTITVNGATCLVDNYVPDDGISPPAPFDQPFFLVLTQALGSGANALNPLQTPLPATMSIDYVRVWK